MISIAPSALFEFCLLLVTQLGKRSRALSL